MVELKFVKTHSDARLPEKNHKDPQTGDAGLDVFSVEDVTVPARGSIIVPVGLKLGFITPGYWFRVEGRSGLGFVKGIQPHFGIIDNPYRGDLGIKLYNLTDRDVEIKAGKGVAQLIVYKMIETTTSFIDEVVESERGEKGFGSSDIHNIKISHEVPLEMLEESRMFNDYDYALVHLFEKYPKYFKFFEKSLEMGREVLLDNSIFELEEAFDEDSFATWITALLPTRYIIPDVLDDSEGTIKNLHSWIQKYSHLPGKKIGVIQGEDYESLIKCYLEVDKYCDEIAISFNYKYYEKQFPKLPKVEAWALGRRRLLSRWLNEGVINKKKRHHLLGCSLPQEFAFYSKFDWIYSLDTSNPIVHGLKGIRYDRNGLSNKVSTKLVDLIEAEPTGRQKADIQYNVNEFKKIVKD